MPGTRHSRHVLLHLIASEPPGESWLGSMRRVCSLHLKLRVLSLKATGEQGHDLHLTAPNLFCVALSSFHVLLGKAL